MGACSLELEWPTHIIASLISLFGGLAILIPARILWCLCRTRNKSLFSGHSSTQSRLTQLRSMAEAIFAGNTIASKTMVIIFWIFDVTAFAIYCTEASLFVPDDRDKCGSTGEPLQCVWILMMVARLVRFVITFAGAQDKLFTWLDVDNVVDHFLIVPTFVGVHFDRNWLGLRFLTVVHLLKTPLILQIIHVLKSKNKIQIVRTIVTVAAVWFIGAGMMVILQNNGDPFPYDDPNSNRGSLGFGESLYFILISLTTIGYGEYVPISVLGRGFMVVYVLLSLALFTSLIPELGKALAKRKKFNKEYRRSYGKCHIVICGNPTFETLSTVVKNFIHEDAAVKKTDLVIIVKDKPSAELQAFFRRRFNDVTFIQGTVLHIPTLKMAKVQSADAVFILANRDAENQDEEDMANIMRATAVKNLASKVRVIIQLLQQHNKEQLLTVSSWNWSNADRDDDEGGDEAVCISELKMALMAQNCLAPGIVTMFSNLICMRSFKESSTNGNWMRSYNYGAGHELYVETFSADFAGMTFANAVILCFTQFGVLLLAVERGDRKGKKSSFHINPGNDFLLKIDDVGVFIAQGPSEVQRVVRFRKEMSPIPYYTPGADTELSVVNSRDLRHLSSTTSTQSDELLEFVGSSCNPRLDQDGVFSDPDISEKKMDRNENDHLCSQEILDQAGLKHWCMKRPLDDATLDEYSIKELDLHDHIVFVLHADCQSINYRQTIGLADFVGPLRTSSLRLSELKPIVFYTDQSVIEKEWLSIANFPQVYFYQRTSSMHSDLRQLNVHRSCICLVMTTTESGKIDNTVVDKNTILTTMNILNLRKLEEKVGQLGVLANPEIFRKQFAIINDFPMLIQLEFDDSIAYIDDDDEDDPSLPLYQTTPYACGRVLLSSVLDSMITTAYLSSKISRFIRTLISGGIATSDFERLVFDGVGLVRRKTLTDVSAARRRSSLALLSLSHGPLEKFQKFTSYGHLMTEALRSCGILCLGLYRLLDVSCKDPKYQKRFVITSPQSNFPVLESDKVYVLKPFEFEDNVILQTDII